MWAIVVAFGFVGGLVKIAYSQSVEPTLKPAWRQAKLVRLARIPEGKLKLEQAEDGIVLSREFDAPELSRRFKRAANNLKKRKRS